MRIVYIHQYYCNPACRAAPARTSWPGGWSARGHEVHVITTDTRPRTRPGRWRQHTDDDGVTSTGSRCRTPTTCPTPRRIRAFARVRGRCRRQRAARARRRPRARHQHAAHRRRARAWSPPGCAGSRSSSRSATCGRRSRSRWARCATRWPSGRPARWPRRLPATPRTSSRSPPAWPTGWPRTACRGSGPRSSPTRPTWTCSPSRRRRSPSSASRARLAAGPAAGRLHRHPRRGQRRATTWSGWPAKVRELDPQVRFLIVGDGKEWEQTARLAAELGRAGLLGALVA